MKQTDELIAGLLARWGVKFSAVYIGERKPFDDKQAMDTFRVSIGAYDTDFHQGLGHRKPAAGAYMPNPPYRKGTVAFVEWTKRNVKPVPPAAAAVLYCLLSDAGAADQSFADWAGDFGYDTDSCKALATYEACCTTGRALREVFTRPQREELQTALQDY